MDGDLDGLIKSLLCLSVRRVRRNERADFGGICLGWSPTTDDPGVGASWLCDQDLNPI